MLLPSLAVAVRRLRDAGLGWGHVFWILLPVAGLIVLVVLLSLRPAPAGVPNSGGTTTAGSDATAG